MIVYEFLDEVSEWFEDNANHAIAEQNIYIDDMGAEVHYSVVGSDLQRDFFDFIDDIERDYPELEIDAGYMEDRIVTLEVRA